MASLQERTYWKSRGLLCSEMVFFVLFYLYVWMYIKPYLIYHGAGAVLPFTAFSVGWSFFEGSLAYPGGLIKYISAFLSQYYYFSWLGALIITIVAWLVCRCTDRLISIAGGSRSKVMCYIPVLLVLIMYNRYSNALTTSLSILTSLWFLIVYERMSPRSEFVRTGLFLLMFVILYYITGGASLIFMVLACLYEIFVRRELFFAGLYLLLGLAVPWLAGTYVFKLTMTDAYLDLLPFHPSYKVSLHTRLKYWLGINDRYLYIFFPAVVLSVMLWQNAIKKRILRRKKRRVYFKNIKLKWVLQSVVLILIVGVSVFFSFDSVKKDMLEMTYLSRNNMWPEVIKLARRIQPRFYNFYYIHDIDRALYHAGRLGYEMFSYPQSIHALLLLKNPGGLGLMAFSKPIDVFLEIGELNLAEKQACEVLEREGPCPFILERLAVINIVKSQTETARVFLNALSKDLIYGDEAKAVLRRLDSDPQLTGDVRIQRLRSVMRLKNYAIPVDRYDEQHLLQSLLQCSRDNKMAFEYLMAYYLLSRQLDKVVENIARLDDFGYKEIPTHYEEAIVLYMDITGKEVDMDGRQISTKTTERYKSLNKIGKFCMRLGYDKQTACRLMARDFGHSYFFYYAFVELRATK